MSLPQEEFQRAFRTTGLFTKPKRRRVLNPHEIWERTRAYRIYAMKQLLHGRITQEDLVEQNRVLQNMMKGMYRKHMKRYWKKKYLDPDFHPKNWGGARVRNDGKDCKTWYMRILVGECSQHRAICH